MTAPRRLQLRRGNSTAISSYTGAAGELVVNTTDWTLYVHDGSTVGGYATTTNTTSINNQISSVNANITVANLGMKGYVDQANTIQSAQIASANIGIKGYIDLGNTIQASVILAANLGMKGYVDSVAGGTSYDNANVRAYLTSFDGNIVPSANVTYSLGDNTHRWRDLYLSGNTIFLGDATITTEGGRLVTTGAAISPPTGAVGFANVQFEAPTDFAQIRSYYVDNNFGYTANLKSWTTAPIVWDQLRSAKFYENSLIIGGATPGFSALDTSGGRFANAVCTLDTTGNIASITITDGGVGYDSYYPYYATDPTGYNSNYIGQSYTGSPTGATFRRIDLIPTTASDLGNVAYLIRGYSGGPDITRGPAAPTVGSNTYTWTGNSGSTFSITIDWTANMSTSWSYTPALPALTSAQEWQDWLLDYQSTNDYGWLIASGSGGSVGGYQAVYDYLNREALPNILTYDIDNAIWYVNNNIINNAGTTATISDNKFSVEFGRTAIGYTTVENSYGNPVYWSRGLSADTGISSGGDMTVAGDLRVTGDLYVSPTSIYMGDLRISAADGNLKVNTGIKFADNTTQTTAYTGSTYSNINVTAYLTTEGYAKTTGITAANVGMKGYVDSQSYYSNTKVSTYLADSTAKTFGGNVTIEGNLFVNGNVTYISVNNVAIGDNIINLADLNPDNSVDLGITAHRNINSVLQHTGLIRDASANQWRLFSNVTQDVGTTVDFTDAIYDDLVLGNITSPTITAINDNIAAANAAIAFANTIQSQQIAAANVGVIGYIDQGNSIQSAAITAANVGMKGYVDNAVSTIVIPVTYSNINVKAYTETMGFANYGNVNVAAYLSTNSYLTSATANLSLYAWNANVGGGGTNYSNVNVKAYTESMGFQNYGNANVSSYLPSHTGNVGVDYLLGTTPNVTLTAGSYNSVFDTTGNVILPTAYVTGNVTAGYFIGNGALLTGIAASSNYSNVQVEVFTNLSNYAYNANVTSANLGMKGYVDNSVSTANIGMKGYVDSVASQSIYGNINVKAYTETMGFQNYGNVNVAALITTNGLTNYSNVNTAAYLNSQGYNLYSNVNVAVYLSTATINTTGNITAAYITGNISITGNVTGTSPNVTLQAGSYSSVFDNLGNVTVPRLFTAGNIQTAGYLYGNGAFLTGVVTGSSYSNVQVATYLPTYTGVVTASNITVAGNVTAQYLFGNGSQLTGLPSSYSNVNVATYLPTYSGNIANIRLGVSGVLTFADGTTQVTAGGGSYSNVQVATYLPLYGGAVQSSNVQTTSANIQATTAATNTATGALRVMGGIGVAGTVFAAQLNTTGNLIANAVSAYSLNTVANVTASVVNAGTINSSGNVLAQNIIGTIATASQTNITAVGTLATLAVSGNATVGNLVGNEANTRIIANTYVTTFDIYGNVTFPGNITVGGFGAVMPTRPAFRVNGTAGPAQTTSNVNLKSPQTLVVFNQGGYYNDTNGKFTAPVAGIYQVSLVARVNTNITSQIAVLKNGINSSGNIVCFWEADASTGTATHFGTGGTVIMAAGEYLSANILTGNVTFDQNDSWSVTYLG